MKKTIAILAVLVIALACVFAAETHKLTLSTTIDEVIPSFQFRYGTAGVYTNDAADSNDIATQTYAGQYPASSEYAVADAIDTGKDLSKEDISADFYAVLAIGGKQDNKTYTLKFTAGAFNTTANHVDDPTPCTSSSIESVLTSDSQYVVVSAGAGSDSADNVKSWKIKLVGSAATSAIDLVKFSATWAKNTDADMGTFTADVTMVVTAQ